jgi:hypothetical protein
MFKPILLYTKHRQTIPIIEENRQDFLLIDFDILWKYLRFLGKTNTSKSRAKVYFLILKILKPEIILDINWIGRVAIIHHIYSRKNMVKLVAVQHGFYTGGYISNRFTEGRWHKMARCTHFWIWSEYISGEVLRNNSTFIVNGNPLYNKLIKMKRPFRKIEKVESILILPTSFEKKDGKKLKKLVHLTNQLVDCGFEVVIKFHLQNEIFPILDNIKILENIDLYEVLYKQEFDLIIADHSTTLLDAMFFNNLVSFCNFHNSPNTLYEKFLGELNIETIEDDLLYGNNQNKIELQTNFMNYLGFNKVYNNSLKSIIE